MEFTNEIICEVKYKKDNMGGIRSELGILNKSEITHFFDNENNFIQFKDKSSPLIPKHEIIEIIKYQEQERFIPNHEKFKLYNSTERRFRAKMCF